MSTDLILYVDRGRESPWAWHARLALEEKGVPYALREVTLPLAGEEAAEITRHGALARVPLLVHGDVAFGESLAISEYVAERFPYPVGPRLFPADLGQRAVARQVMSFVRVEFGALRAARPTTMLLGRTPVAPLSGEAAAQARRLLDVAGRLLPAGRQTLGGAWSIADFDLAVALLRIHRGGDVVPAHLAAYAEAQWDRPSAMRARA